MMREILSLEALIASMEETICRRLRFAPSILCAASSIFSAATFELAALCRAMELISWLEDEVSSREAACLAAPSARACEEDDTWHADAVAWSVTRSSSLANSRRTWLTPRTMQYTAPPTARHKPSSRKAARRLPATRARASWLAVPNAACCPATSWSAPLPRSSMSG